MPPKRTRKPPAPSPPRASRAKRAREDEEAKAKAEAEAKRARPEDDSSSDSSSDSDSDSESPKVPPPGVGFPYGAPSGLANTPSGFPPGVGFPYGAPSGLVNTPSTSLGVAGLAPVPPAGVAFPYGGAASASASVPPVGVAFPHGGAASASASAPHTAVSPPGTLTRLSVIRDEIFTNLNTYAPELKVYITQILILLVTGLDNKVTRQRYTDGIPALRDLYRPTFTHPEEIGGLPFVSGNEDLPATQTVVDYASSRHTVLTSEDLKRYRKTAEELLKQLIKKITGEEGDVNFLPPDSAPGETSSTIMVDAAIQELIRRVNLSDESLRDIQYRNVLNLAIIILGELGSSETGKLTPAGVDLLITFFSNRAFSLGVGLLCMLAPYIVSSLLEFATLPSVDISAIISWVIEWASTDAGRMSIGTFLGGVYTRFHQRLPSLRTMYTLTQSIIVTGFTRFIDTCRGISSQSCTIAEELPPPPLPEIPLEVLDALEGYESSADEAEAKADADAGDPAEDSDSGFGRTVTRRNKKKNRARGKKTLKKKMRSKKTRRRGKKARRSRKKTRRRG